MSEGRMEGIGMLSALDVQRIITEEARAAGEKAKDVTPTDEQVRIIESPLRPLLVVAGAGSGKTETMAMRVLWIVGNHEDVPPASVLGLTFTKKAAGELGARLSSRVRLLGKRLGGFDPNEEPVALTYNAFAQRIVAEHGLRIGCDPDFRMLGQAGAVQLMTDILSKWPRALDPDLSISSGVRAALHLAGQLSEHGLSVDAGRRALAEFDAELAEAGESNPDARSARRANARRIALLDPIAAFEARKRDEGVLDFPDQLALATRIVTESPEAVAQIRAEHRCVLLDEFQDTSVIQMRLLSALFHDHPVTAVGDPNQAIYGWRGASASSLENFLPLFQSGEAASEQTLGLSTAWRNDRRILVAANAVAKPLREAARAAASPVLVESPAASEGEVRIAFAKNRAEEIRAVVDRVAELREKDPAHRRSIAILTRKRKHFLPLDRALRERGIPTQIVGFGGLLDQPAVADLRAALEIAHDVAASPALARLLVRADIGAADLAALGQWARELARRAGRDEHSAILLEAVDAPPAPGWRRNADAPAISGAAVRRVGILGGRLRRLRAMRGRGLVELCERALGLMGILDDAIADPLGGGAREALDAFIDVVADFESTVDGASLGGLLAWLDAAESEERGLEGVAIEPDPSAVQILTVHAAKGLEWDSVIVFGLTDCDFPSHRGNSVDWRADPPGSIGWVNSADELPHPLRGDAADLPAFEMDLSRAKTPSASFAKWLKEDYKPALGAHEEREERRLAYVALTRAKHDELLVGAWIDSGKTARFPSRYLEESRAALVKDLEGAIATGAVVRGDGAVLPIDEGAAADIRRTLKDLADCVAERPDLEEVASLLIAEPEVDFPLEPGPSRVLIAGAADRVRRARAGLRTDADVFEVLDDLGPSERVRDVVALLEERRLEAETGEFVLWRDRVPATSVSRLIEDPSGFALDMRRPVPQAPSAGASLGTIFHAWAERQLHQASGELWDEPIVGEDSLDEEGRERLARMKENFAALDIVRNGRPLAIEEPFALEVAGISVTGRIDAVFEDADGRIVVVDWKSGIAPTSRTDASTLRYFATQLRLYRSAWSAVHGTSEGEIRALVAFVASGRVMALDEVEAMAGIDEGTSIDALLAESLARA